jgi:hypothetical protein
VVRPDRVHQRLGLRPGGIAVEDVDFDAHFVCRAVKIGCVEPRRNLL